MADILIADRQHHAHRHSRSIGGLDNGQLRTAAPKIEMVANPAFSFPMKPSTPGLANRPSSMLLPQSAQPTVATAAHKRAVSALPSFTFNATDSTGRHDELTPPRTPDENAMSSAAAAASKRGHRRGGSEFVGGDSRFGMSSAISSSPTKTSNPQLPLPSETGSPAKRRSHAHRRSVAVSSHDLSQIMSTAEQAPRLSSSLPSSPMEMPVATFQRSGSAPAIDDQVNLEAPATAPRDDSPARPVSRPRVEFSEEVEIIPRPLSTISSETESSFSTIRGHSVNDSITSVLSIGSTSPASPRARAPQEQVLAPIAEPRSKRSSIELSKRLEREGEWLKSKTSEQDVAQGADNIVEPITPPPQTPERSIVPPAKRQKRQSLGQTFGFDRRRSEPAISVAAAETSRLSAISLHDVMAREAGSPETAQAMHERRFSGHRLKHWVASKLHRRSRDSVHAPQSPVIEPLPAARPETAESVDVPGKISVSQQAETNLDTVFGALDDEPVERASTRAPSRLTFDTSPHFEQSAIDDTDDEGTMLDLDAATEPLRTPPLGTHRRQLHSDRASKQVSASGGFVHRRAESEPALMSFNYTRAASSSQKSMEDVFEEDEEEDDTTSAGPADGMGITIVDADDSTSSVRRQTPRDAPRPSTSYITPTPRLFVPTSDRPASFIDEVIVEESSPVEEPADGVEVVQAHEEPRAPSLEKLSDSSEASTLLGASLSALPDRAPARTLDTSAFPSPDLLRRQGSFEASRVGTSASSLADTRTTSSCTTGDGLHDPRMSVDDVPSLTSSRSTMLSTSHANSSARNITEPIPRTLDPAHVAAHRKKRASIQSLSQLMSGPFGSKTKLQDESRPQTAMMNNPDATARGTKKRDNRLKKLMFWRSRQSLREAASADANV